MLAVVVLCAVGTGVSSVGALAAAESAQVIPLFTSASDPEREGFARVINHSERRGTVRIVAIDDTGKEYEPIELSLGARESAHFNSRDLETGNASKGLSGGLGAGQGSWRLHLSSDLDIEPLSYIRTVDGFVTAMHEMVPAAAMRHHVTIFNPGSNRAQRSRLRLINPTGEEVEVTIKGRDDAGAGPDGAVRLTLAPGQARAVGALELETGGEGITGSLGDGYNKWQLFVSAGSPIQVMNLLQSPTGHLSNLSVSGLRSVAGSRGAVEGEHFLPFFLPASDPEREGFARVINHSERRGTVRIVAIDDTGKEYEPIELSLGARESAHFNSRDLETGNASKGLSGGLGAGQGSWRLRLYSGLDIEPSAYVRTRDGFVTTMHEVVREAAMGHHVMIFNPGSNRAQRSRLRLINPTGKEVEVTIEGRDDAGAPGRAGPVRLTLAPGQARAVGALELETGGEGFTGSLGDGYNKWQLFVSADRPIHVMSLLQSPTGHLSNLSAPGIPNIVTPAGINRLPTVAIDPEAAVTVTEGEVLELSASVSDAHGSIASWQWEQISGPAFDLHVAHTSRLVATAPPVAADTSAAFRVTVTDDAGNRGSDEHRVEVAALVRREATIATEISVPAEVTTVRTGDLTARALGSDGTEVAGGESTTLLLASDEDGTVMLSLADRDGGLLGEPPGEAQVSVASTAVTLVAFAAGYRIPAITREVAQEVVSHADYDELVKQLIWLMNADKNFLDRLYDYPEMVDLIKRMAVSLRRGAGAARARVTSSGAAAKSALPEGIEKKDFWCTPNVEYPCSPWDEHEPWRWFGDAKGISAFRPDNAWEAAGELVAAIVNPILAAGAVLAEGYGDFLVEATHPPFLARSEKRGSRHVHAAANPNFSAYAMELYKGSEYRGWYYVPGNATLLWKMHDSGAHYREALTGYHRLLNPDIDEVRFQRYRKPAPDDEDGLLGRSVIVSFANTLHVTVSIVSLLHDFSAITDWLNEFVAEHALVAGYAYDQTLDIAGLTKCLASFPEFFVATNDPNEDVKVQMFRFFSNVPALIGNILRTKACRTIALQGSGKLLEDVLVQLRAQAVVAALVKAYPVAGWVKLGFDTADAVPVFTSYIHPGVGRSRYFIEWNTSAVPPYIARVNEHPPLVADFEYEQLSGIRIKLDGAKSEGEEPLRYRWEVAGERIGIGRVLVHEFDETGAFEVTLTVEDARGNTNSNSAQITVTNGRTPVVTRLTCAPTGEGKAFSMDLEFSDADGDVASLEWFASVGNSRPDEVTGAGQRRVTLTAPAYAPIVWAKVKVVDWAGNAGFENCPVAFGKDVDVGPLPTFRDCAECPEMVVVPAGSYRMGLSHAEADGLGASGFHALPDHVVTIAEPFAVGAHEVTRREWSVFVSEGGDWSNFYCFTPPRNDTRTIGLVWNADARWDRPGFAQSDAHPAVCVSWQDAREYVEWLSDRTGEDYRLLSESEWEYAARGGRSTSSRHWYEHSSQACVHANARDRSMKEAYPLWAGSTVHDCRDGYVYTAPVASFAPNEYGLHDMLGNAREWTEDCWNRWYFGAPADGSARGGCAFTFGHRVIRGGSWYGKPGEVQLWYRDELEGGAQFANLGFRVARTLD